MRELSVRNLPITRQRMLTTEVRARYAEEGFTDKIALLDTRPRLYSQLYTLDDTAGYFYGSLAPSTGYVTLFDIEPYYNGFYLALPLRTSPDTLHRNVHQEKMFGIFQEYQSWVRIMGVPTVGDVNSKVLAGDGGGLIKLAEAFHERKFAWVADTIYDAHLSRGARMVLISGPSSSGKTTSAKRLGIQLGVLGLRPVMISLDDYFVDREKTPLDENGDYDYEALEAIDLELFNDHLARLIRGESVDIPRYDFITGRRTWHNAPLTLDERSILIIEGIHGLNPRLTPSIPDAQKFRIYISCFTSVAMDNLSRIATTDNRLLRRLTEKAGACFIVNDHIDIAMLVGADGVHIGQEDLPVPEVRRLVGPDMLIGLSTHSPEQAVAAVNAGADYIGVGPIFATQTKEDVVDPVGFDYLDWVARNIELPFVAIGGIKAHNIAEVARHGARCCALVSELVGARDIPAQVEAVRLAMRQGLGQ